MSVSYKNLRTDRQWKSTTGLGKRKFRELVKVFKESFIEIFGKELRDRQGGSSQEAHLKNYEEYLFFILFSLKSGLTYDNLGFVFGMSGGNAKKIQTEGVQILQIALNKLEVMPQRVFNDAKEFRTKMKDEEILKIDGTEQPTQRPVNQEDQKARYSGKKRHTVKTVVVSNEHKQILYVSNCYEGREHDFSILKEEFEPGQGWFKNHSIQLDLGFQGFSDYYQCGKLEIPEKKKRKSELTQSQKEANKEKASKRVTVEHAIGGMKRYRILSDRLRTRDFDFYNKVVGICAGLWNLLITD